MKLRFLPMAWASLIRMPDGRLSNTSLNMRLYVATAPAASSDSPSAGVAISTPGVQSIDRLLHLRQNRGVHRKLAQTARQQHGNTTGIAGHLTAQADAHPRVLAVVDGAANQLQHPRMERVDQCFERTVGPIAGS